MTATEAHRAIHAVWRIEAARLIAGLARFVRDVGLELVDALTGERSLEGYHLLPEVDPKDAPRTWRFTIP